MTCRGPPLISLPDTALWDSCLIADWDHSLLDISFCRNSSSHSKSPLRPHSCGPIPNTNPGADDIIQQDIITPIQISSTLKSPRHSIRYSITDCYQNSKCGIRGNGLIWIEAFLTNRRQSVILWNGHSNWEHVKSSVLQGSILSPLLFLIPVNDMPEVVSNVTKMLTDDTKVYSWIKTSQDCEKWRQHLNNLAASQKWLLSFNATKHVVEHQNDLGITVANTLKPDTHITQITKKGQPENRHYLKMFTDLSETKAKTLYQAIVRPILLYASPDWNLITKKILIT